MFEGVFSLSTGQLKEFMFTVFISVKLREKVFHLLEMMAWDEFQGQVRCVTSAMCPLGSSLPGLCFLKC